MQAAPIEGVPSAERNDPALAQKSVKLKFFEWEHGEVLDQRLLLVPESKFDW